MLMISDQYILPKASGLQERSRPMPGQLNLKVGQIVGDGNSQGFGCTPSLLH